jgi:hypothetical protein
VWPAELIVHLDASGDVDITDGASVATPAALTDADAGGERRGGSGTRAVAGAGDARMGRRLPSTRQRFPKLVWKVFVPATLQDQWW